MMINHLFSALSFLLTTDYMQFIFVILAITAIFSFSSYLLHPVRTL